MSNVQVTTSPCLTSPPGTDLCTDRSSAVRVRSAETVDVGEPGAATAPW